MKAIEIGDDCKYVIIIDDEDGISSRSDLQNLLDVLKKWWESEEKFVILSERNNIKIRFQRMDEL